MLAKFSPPSKLDSAPLHSLWQFIHSDKSHEYYIQMSADENKPSWERLGFVLEKAFEFHIVNDPSFIEDVIRLISMRIVEIEKPEA